MNPENNSQSSPNPSQPGTPPSTWGGEKVIQPSESIKQELQAQQSPEQQAIQPPVASPQSQPQIPAPNPANIYPESSSPGQMQVGMSASQMGYNQPKNKLFDLNPKQLILKSVVGLVILGGIFAGLVMADIVALSEFKTVNYSSSAGDRYELTFYSKHSSRETTKGTKQLVSKISKEGKFPLALSVSAGKNGLSGYERLKDCSSYKKVFDVQNANLNQKISVCDAMIKPAGGQNTSNVIYVAGFTHKDTVHTITISQDYAGIDLSSQSAAKESLTRFGMEPYKEDIEKIVSSINVE